MEQAVVVGVEGLVERVLGAAAVPHEGDVLRIAAQLADVLPHPAQGGLLVQQTPVAAHALPVDDVQVPERADAIGDRDDDDVLLRQASAVVDGQGSRTAVPAVDEYEHGLGVIGSGRPDVQAQGVLAHEVVARPPLGPQLEVAQEEVRRPGHEALREALPQPRVDRKPPVRVVRSVGGDGRVEALRPRIGDAENAEDRVSGP